MAPRSPGKKPARRLAPAALLLLLAWAAPALALTVENASNAVLYCSVYREGYAMPLVQFVLLPGKSHSWSPARGSTRALTVRAVPEPGQGSAQPATHTVRDQHAVVRASRDQDRIVLAPAGPIPVR